MENRTWELVGVAKAWARNRDRGWIKDQTVATELLDTGATQVKGGTPLALQWRPAARDDIQDSDRVKLEGSAPKSRCYRNSAGIEIVSSAWVKRAPCMNLITIKS